MTVVELRRLVSMIRWFTNWREVYSGLLPAPSCRPFNCGTRSSSTIRPGDLVMMQIGKVLGGKSYRKVIIEPPAGTMIDIGANIGVVSLH
jgi:hypothetical protein